MENNKVRVAFIGCGDISDYHFRALKKCQNAELVGVHDIREKVGMKKAQDWKVKFYSNYEDIINNKDIDAVFILTLEETHYDFASKTIKSGKHAMIEKPVSFDYKKIEDLEKLAAKHKVVCMPGHSYLYLPEITRIAQMTKQNVIGQPNYMYMSEIYFMPQEVVDKFHGPVKEVLCHQIYLMIAFLGMPSKVQCFISGFRKNLKPAGEEQAIVNIKYSNGALVNLFISWCGDDETSDPWTFKIKVLGTNGGLHFSRRDAIIKNEWGPEKELWYQPMYDEMFDKEVDYFINKAILSNEKPLSTIRDAAATIYVLDAIIASIKESKIIEVNENYIKEGLY